jgi:hypothetical protein
VKAVRKRLTYANVMSSIAVFLVLGGATAFAANQLGKNSVGSKQLKKNAVTAAKLKKNAVTGAKIKPGAINGTKIDEATLGTVPSAATAGSANVAASLSGYQHNSIRMAPTPVASYEAGVDGAPETALFSAGPLTITAKCFSYSGSLYGMFFIRTSEDGAAFWGEYNYTSGNESKYLLNTSTPPNQRTLFYQSTGSDYAYYEAEESEFAAAAANGTTVRGGLQIGIKAGTLKGGSQGVFGPGSVCLMAGNMFTL